MIMSQWTEADVQRVLSDRGKARQDAAPKPSKYKNIKVVIDGERFDSKREAQYFQELKLREKAGEIYDVKRQVEYALTCPTREDLPALVSSYLADFTFWEVMPRDEPHAFHIVDIKGGKETAMFTLKRKWLYLQSGIDIEVVR